MLHVHVRLQCPPLKEAPSRAVKYVPKGGVLINREAEKRHSLASVLQFSALSHDIRALLHLNVGMSYEQTITQNRLQYCTYGRGAQDTAYR